MIYITSDHGGFKLKQIIYEYVKTLGLEITDVGPNTLVLDDDYPDYIKNLTPKIAENPTNMGIVICRNGVGVAMFANRFKGIRCGLSWTPEHAKSGRNDDDTNVLALPADYIEETTAKSIVKMWLETPFSSEERFTRRLKKIE